MFQVAKQDIRKLAANDTVYSRGLRYYNNGQVTGVSWANAQSQYIAHVKGKSEYQVVIGQDKDQNITYYCNCPAAVKEKGACKHVVATLLYISDYVRRSKINVPDDEKEKKIYQIIEYFSRPENLTESGELFSVETMIWIPKVLRKSTDKAYVQIQAGSRRMYKVQNIKKFLMEYSEGKNLILGKEFRYLAGESHFDSDSMEVLSYLQEVYEIHESMGKVYYSELFQKGMMALTKNMLIKLFKVLEGKSFTLQLYQTTREGVSFSSENPHLNYEIEVIENAISFKDSGNGAVIPITENGELLYYNNIIYKPDKKFLKYYVPFYGTSKEEPLLFQGENKNKFLETVLPKIYKSMDIVLPSEIKEKYITEDLEVKIFLDSAQGGVKAELEFTYGTYRFNPLAAKTEEDIIVVRQKEREETCFDALENLSFRVEKDYYLLTEERRIFDFLSTGVHTLSAQYEVYYSDALKAIQIKKAEKMSANIHYQTIDDLLELSFQYENIPKDELADFFHSFRLKKKYHRLKSGDFISLEEPDTAVLRDLMDQLNLSGKDFAGGTLRLPKNTGLFLRDIMEQEKILTFENEEFEHFLKSVYEPDQKEWQFPEGIEGTLRPYQITGFHWMKALAAHNLGGILADDMGLGKTLQAIVYIASCLQEGKGPHLIVCPTSLVYNWQDEFDNFAPGISTLVVTGMPAEREKIIFSGNENTVYLTSYPLLRKDIDYYAKLQFDTVMIDEAQFIKNAASLSARSVKKIKSRHQFALTGTPIENSLSELWSIFDFIMPGYLFGHSKFVDRYEKPIMQDEDEKITERLSLRIRPFVLRRMKKDVLEELPPKLTKKMLTELTEPQKKVYLYYLEQIRGDLYGEEAFGKNKIKVLAALTRLRQICCHPSTFIENYKGGSGKMDLLMEIVPQAIANQHRILIFSQFTSMLKIIRKELEDIAISSFYLEGQTDAHTRRDYVNRFNAGENDVFLISLKAGGTGLNLTGADMVIHFDPWWNPAVEDQAADRAYRIGQKNTVQVIKLIAKGTIEEKIYKLQKRKQKLSGSVIVSQESLMNQLTKEELEDIFSEF